MPDKIGSSQGTVKLYDVNRSKPLSESVYQSSDGRITLAQPQIKRQAFTNPCDPATGFLHLDGSCSDDGLNRANTCNKYALVADTDCGELTTCSHSTGTQCTTYTTSTTAVRSYYGASYSCGWWGTSTCTPVLYEVYLIYSTTMRCDPTFTYENRYQHLRLADGATITRIKDCDNPNALATPADIGVQIMGGNLQGSPCCVSSGNCITSTEWSDIGNSVADWCDWTPTIAPPTTASPTTSNEVVNSTEIPAPSSTQITPSSTDEEVFADCPNTCHATPTKSDTIGIFGSTTVVNKLPHNSQALLTSYATPVPSMLPTSNTALAALGVLAVMPIGVGIVAAVVGAYGIYKWCHKNQVTPDNSEDGDVKDTPQEIELNAITESVVDLAQTKAQVLVTEEAPNYEAIDNAVYEEVN